MATRDVTVLGGGVFGLASAFRMARMGAKVRLIERHAIGAGCFLVEIQEPTDYTIRVERTTPSGFAVADSMCHQGLGFEKMFECFHYEPHSREEIHDRWFIEPETVLKTAGGSITTLVGYRNTPLFRLDEVNVSDTLTVDCPPRGSGYGPPFSCLLVPLMATDWRCR